MYVLYICVIAATLMCENAECVFLIFDIQRFQLFENAQESLLFGNIVYMSIHCVVYVY